MVTVGCRRPWRTRLDYTIIGAEANLASRLQSIAEPGGIVLSYETWSLVRQMVRARPLEAITLKGIARPVVPYAVDGRLDDAAGRNSEVISESGAGLDLFLDVRALDASAASAPAAFWRKRPRPCGKSSRAAREGPPSSGSTRRSMRSSTSRARRRDS